MTHTSEILCFALDNDLGERDYKWLERADLKCLERRDFNDYVLWSWGGAFYEVDYITLILSDSAVGFDECTAVEAPECGGSFGVGPILQFMWR